MKVICLLASALAVLAPLPGTIALAQQQPGVGAAAPGYVLGPNDEIEITVFNQPNLSSKTRINGDGTIVMPLIGSIQAAGRTTAQLNGDLTRAYGAGGYLKDPSISVEIATFVSKAATVLGNVANAGNYPLDRDYTIAMLIARAGGVRADGANAVKLTRPDGTSERLSLADAAGATRRVQPGDTLFVPAAEMVYVYGQVNTPGAFPYQPGITYRQALARAGGPTLAGSTRKIEVRRDGKRLKDIDLDAVAQPEDVLIIKEKLF